MTKNQQLLEKILVTAIEADLIYLSMTSNFQWNRAGLAALLGAAFSAVYNVLRQSQPTIPTPTPQQLPKTISAVAPTTPSEDDILNDLANEETPPVTPAA